MPLLKIIRARLLNSNRLHKYLLYAMGEIILVVLGILIALKINNWNNERINQNKAESTYSHIRDQINEDQRSLTEAKGVNAYFSGTYAYASSIISSQDKSRLDTLAYLSMGLSQYSDFRRSGNIYETLVNSGDISLLENRAITDGLQRLDITYNHINKIEDIHWEVIITELSPLMRGVINYATLQVVEPDKLYSVEMQNMVIESLFLTKAKDSVYNTALKEVKTLIEQLNLELDDQ